MTILTAMKQALNALNIEAGIYNYNDPEDGPPEYIVEAVTSLRAAIEEVEKAEPVAYMDNEDNELVDKYSHFAEDIPLYKYPPDAAAEIERLTKTADDLAQQLHNSICVGNRLSEENSRLKKERNNFRMYYRMKCDVEGKTLREQNAKLREVLDAVGEQLRLTNRNLLKSMSKSMQTLQAKTNMEALAKLDKFLALKEPT